MGMFVRYALECLVSLFVVQLLHCWYFSYSTSKLDHPSEFEVTSDVRMDQYSEPYDAIRDDVARDLYTKVRVLCWVMTAPKNHWKKARHIKNTWGKRCNILLFMSTEEDARLPTVKLPAAEGYNFLWGKTREAFRYIWKHYRHQAEWFLKADDDSFIVPENLRYFLSNYNTSDPLYFGHRFKAYIKNGYMQGGSGYVLSQEALRRFVKFGLDDPVKCNLTIGAEDVEISQCLNNLECKGMDTRDSYKRERFLPLYLEYHLVLGITDNTWLWELHPSFYEIHKGFDCCSDTAIGFHQVTPEQMYVYYYLIYRLRPYGVEDVRPKLQRKPQPPPDLNLQELPFPGPSDADLQRIQNFKKQEEQDQYKFRQTQSKNARGDVEKRQT